MVPIKVLTTSTNKLEWDREAGELDSLHSLVIALNTVSSSTVRLVNLTAFVLCRMSHVFVCLVYFMLPEVVLVLVEINFNASYYQRTNYNDICHLSLTS